MSKNCGGNERSTRKYEGNKEKEALKVIKIGTKSFSFNLNGLLCYLCLHYIHGGKKPSRMGCVVLVVCMGHMRSTYKILVRNPEVKILIARPKSRWKNNVNTDLTEIRYEACGLA
jgi:hypothetical protein